jgi:hypothetical protein
VTPSLCGVWERLERQKERFSKPRAYIIFFFFSCARACARTCKSIEKCRSYPLLLALRYLRRSFCRSFAAPSAPISKRLSDLAHGVRLRADYDRNRSNTDYARVNCAVHQCRGSRGTGGIVPKDSHCREPGKHYGERATKRAVTVADLRTRREAGAIARRHLVSGARVSP